MADILFKNQGLDLIEVQDNGSGIAPANYASVALKHHTSKLSNYDDIASLKTFGFRGEALASLCSLSNLSIITCQAKDAPRGSKLTFEPSGQLQSTSVVAAQRGTVVSVANLFHTLPVRRRELERNIKREYQKVIALLNQYACIQTNLKFSVSQQPTKGKRILLFSTKGNPTTRENIINIFGAKAMHALVPLELDLELRPTGQGPSPEDLPQSESASNVVRITGHVSRPAHGEGRQTPDRQMFFVNGRPCGLPQIAKTFNEVYRSYNSSQSPFIFADIQLDTHMYDVNVSPDKRSILLHDQHLLLDNLRSSLLSLFDSHDHTMPLVRSTGADAFGPARKGQKKSIDPTSYAVPLKANSENKTASGAESEDDDENSSSQEAEPRDPSVPAQFGKIMTSKLIAKEGRDQNLISQWVTRKHSSALHTFGHVSTSTENRLSGPQQALRTSSPERTLAERNITESSQSDSGSAYEPTERSRRAEAFDNVSRASCAGDDALSRGLSSSHSPIRSSNSGGQLSELPIPAVWPLKLDQGRLRGSHSANSAKRPSLVQSADVFIGDPPAAGLRAPYVKRPRAARQVSEGQPKATFGTSLSNLFSAAKDSAEQVESDQDEVKDDDVHSNGVSSSHEDDDVGDVNDVDGRDAGSSQTDSEGSRSGNSSLPWLNVDLGESTTHVGSPRVQSLGGTYRRKDSTTHLVLVSPASENLVHSNMSQWKALSSETNRHVADSPVVDDITAPDAESKLLLIISRSDFLKMRVAGQFNMGFIIAVRQSRNPWDSPHGTDYDELFIIDQHASDEKYNFERLQERTVLRSQRLVQPLRLDLTALEEEILIQNMSAIEANGFNVEVDASGDQSVGSRCQLTALPLSRETTFELSDLEELISLLGDSPSNSSYVPRPSKVRKMLAMRACRSSIMIGKALTDTQMYGLVRHMGEMDKPWNCPHGRPTMRHLCRLDAWDNKGWGEDRQRPSASTWRAYIHGSGS